MAKKGKQGRKIKDRFGYHVEVKKCKPPGGENKSRQCRRWVKNKNP